MPLNPSATGSGLVSSSAVLVVIVGVLLVFLAHRPISEWLASRHSDVREHFYGPEELYQPEPDKGQDAEDDSEPEASASQPDPDDGFDYGIFASPPPHAQ